MNPQWGYMSILDRLSNGDITKHNEVFKLSWAHCLNMLLYWKEKDEYIEKINKIREQESKSKTKPRR